MTPETRNILLALAGGLLLAGALFAIHWRMTGGHPGRAVGPAYCTAVDVQTKDDHGYLVTTFECR